MMVRAQGHEAPDLEWLLNGGPPPLNCADTLAHIAFGGLLLECAGGEASDLRRSFTTEEVARWQLICRHISREYELDRVVTDPSDTWKMLGVREQDFGTGIWATLRLRNDATKDGSHNGGYRVSWASETIVTWLQDLIVDAKQE